MSPEPADNNSWSGLDGFQKILGHRSRLGICALLRKLEDERFVTVRKEFQDRKPVSWYQLTTTGRQRLEAHLAALSGLLGKGE